MVLSIEYAIESCWTEVCKKVKDAVVYVDECSTECLHWHGGLIRFLNSGAVGVKEFSANQVGNNAEKKAVFLVKSPMVGPPRMILRDIISNSAFNHCILITSCSPVALTLATTGNVPEGTHELTALHKLERDMLHWMKNEDYTAEIFHFPYGFISITPSFFVTPAFADLFPCFDTDFENKYLQNSGVSDWVTESLPLELQVAVVYLMSTLNALLSQLNVREDIYCLGPFSNLVGSQLQKQSTSVLRAKTASSTMSLILIDRTLDVCSCTSLEEYSFLDCMKSVLQPFPSHSIDVAVDMSPLCSAKVASNLPGCLHEPKNSRIEWLIDKKPGDVLKTLVKEICSICNQKEKTHYSPSELEDIIVKNFSGNYDLIRKHSGLLQFTLGITQTLKSSGLEKMKLIGSFQKLLLQALARDNNANDAVHQIVSLIDTRKSKGIELEHILLVLIFFYSFIGDKYSIDLMQEELISGALKNAYIEDKEKYTNNCILNFNSFTDADLFCSHVFKKLNGLKSSRQHLTKYRNVAYYEDMMLPLEYRSVLKQLLEDITNPNKPEIEDLRHKPNLSLRDNFASRFSMILSSSRSRIMDNDSCLIFVIGGVTAREVKFIRDFFKPFDQLKTVIVGSTAFTSPVHLIKNLFVNDPLKPVVI